MNRKTRAGRYALITGAGGGLGSAFALEAVRKGWNLLLVDLPGSGVQDLAQRLGRAYRVDVRPFPMDLASRDERARLLAWISEKGFAVDLLVNNAGTGSCSPFESAPLPRLAGIVEVNVQALMQLTYLLLPELRRQPKAVIINVASLAAFYPMPSMAVYAATKAFILNFSLAIRQELAGSGVTVSALCPAGMVTNRDTADQVEAQGFFGRITTWYPERVASLALRQAWRGRDVIIPGVANRLIRFIGGAVPRGLAARVIGGRWSRTSSRLPAGPPAGPPAFLPASLPTTAAVADPSLL